MLAFGDNHAFDAIKRNLVETHGEEKSVWVEDLDLFPYTRPQRAGEVAGVATDDDGAPAFTLGEKRRQRRLHH